MKSAPRAAAVDPIRDAVSSRLDAAKERSMLRTARARAGQPSLSSTAASGNLSLGRRPVPRETVPTRRGPRQSSAWDAAPDTRADDLEAPADAVARAATRDAWNWTYGFFVVFLVVLLLGSLYQGVFGLRDARRTPAKRSAPAAGGKEASSNLVGPVAVSSSQLLKGGPIPPARDVAKRGPPSDRSRRTRPRVDRTPSANKRPLEGAADRESKKARVGTRSSTRKRSFEGAVTSKKRLRSDEQTRSPTQQPTGMPTAVPTVVPTGVPTSAPTTTLWHGCTSSKASSKEHHDILTNGKAWNEEGRIGLVYDMFDADKDFGPDEEDTCPQMQENFGEALEGEIVTFALSTDGIDTNFPQTVFDTFAENSERWNISLVRSGCKSSRNRQVAVHRGFCDDVREMAEELDDSHIVTT
jgi:hypothetical protein